MKIALIIEHFDSSRGGAEHLAVWLANQLAARGHEVHIVCHDVHARINRFRQATLRASHDADSSHRAHPGEPHDDQHAGLHLHRLRGMRVHTAMGLRLFGSRARQWIARNRPDVAHSLTVACPGDIYHAYAGVYAAMQTQSAASRAKGPVASLKHAIFRLHGKQQSLVALERRALLGPQTSRGATAQFVLSLCDMTSRQFTAAYPEAAKKIIALPQPRMDLPATRPLSPEDAAAKRQWLRGHYRLAEGDRVALFVGHDFRRKGLRYAIEAVARARDWKLLIVGLGKTREYVEMADALDIGPSAGKAARILFVGPTHEMSALYAAGDALLMPAFYEPSNMVLLEALSHGLPVVSTDFLGGAELVRANDAGTIVPSPRDVEALASALEALPAAGSAAQRSLAQRARHAGEGIAPDAYVKSLLALYQKVRSA